MTAAVFPASDLTSSSSVPLEIGDGADAATYLEALLGAMPAAIYVCDRLDRIQTFNRRAAELWGRKPKLDNADDRFCGSLRLFRPDGTHLPHAECPMATVLETGEPARDLEVLIERPDGSRITALVNIVPLRSPRGALIGALNCFNDVTDRREMEAQVQRSEQHLRDVIEALPTAVYTVDVRGRITMFNQAAADLWGGRPEPEKDRWCGPWTLFWPDGTPMPHDQCPMAVALKEDRPIKGAEATAERADGSRVTFLAYPTPLHDGSGLLTGAVNMLVDITSRKQMEERQAMLLSELDHRVKNSLSVVQALFHQTFRSSGSLENFYNAFSARLAAVAHAHQLLSAGRWEGAKASDVLATELAPYREVGRVRMEVNGHEAPLRPEQALGLALILNELATNALKYGALSIDSGDIEIVVRTVGTKMEIHWREGGLSNLSPTAKKGFGLGFVESACSYELGGACELVFEPDGLRCNLFFH